MKASPKPSAAGLTLIEVTLVISLLLGLISVLFMGTKVYKESTDRAACIQQVAKIQQAMRSYCNMHEFYPGDTVDLKSALIRPGGFYSIEPTCPANGTYNYYPTSVPPVGTPYVQCSLPSHEPSSVKGW